MLNVETTMTLLDSLGLTINLVESNLIPCQQLTFLGFILCSVSMLVKLTDSRLTDIIVLCKYIKDQKRVTIRHFSKLIGKLVAAESRVEHAPLYYKPLEKNQRERT